MIKKREKRLTFSEIELEGQMTLRIWNKHTRSGAQRPVLSRRVDAINNNSHHVLLDDLAQIVSG